MSCCRNRFGIRITAGTPEGLNSLRRAGRLLCDGGGVAVGVRLCGRFGHFFSRLLGGGFGRLLRLLLCCFLSWRLGCGCCGFRYL